MLSTATKLAFDPKIKAAPFKAWHWVPDMCLAMGHSIKLFTQAQHVPSHSCSYSLWCSSKPITSLSPIVLLNDTSFFHLSHSRGAKYLTHRVWWCLGGAKANSWLSPNPFMSRQRCEHHSALLTFLLVWATRGGFKTDIAPKLLQLTEVDRWL